MIGSTIAHYKITAKLGEGGMGEVYRARDDRLKRDVAVKLLPQSVQEDPARLTRFKREAQNALTLACGRPTMAIHVWYRRQDSNLYAPRDLPRRHSTKQITSPACTSQGLDSKESAPPTKRERVVSTRRTS